MAAREEIIERWQTRLAEAESEPSDTSQRGLWMRKVYARIYRFLLACYGRAKWEAPAAERADVSTSDVDEVDASQTLTRTQLVIALKGKPAKSDAQIGKVLQAVHAANGDAQSNAGVGSPAAVAGKDIWIRAGEFNRAQMAWKFHRILLCHGIESYVVHVTGRYFVEIRRTDLDLALDLYRSNAAALRGNTSRKRQSGVVHLVKFITAVGIILFACAIPVGISVAYIEAKQPLPAAVVAVTVVLSAVLAAAGLSSILYRPPRS